MITIKQNLRVCPYILGFLWPFTGTLIFSGMMGTVPALNPENVALVYTVPYNSLSHHKAEAVLEHTQNT